MSSTSAITQRAKIIRLLKMRGNQGATIREISQALDILDPRKRISEIRHKGTKILDIWEYWDDGNGDKHYVKRYFYGGEQRDK